MKLNEYLANAAILPPSAPDTPSVGYPSLGDQQTGVRATLVGDYWYYQVQQEIANLLSAAAVTADSADLTQLGQAVLALGAGNLQVADAAALRLVDLKESIQVAQTFGALTAGDGGGGMWRWDAASTAADNVGTVLLPTGHVGAGRWVRQWSGPLDVRWFGAAGADADYTTQLQAAIDAAVAIGRSVYIPAGTYRVSASLTYAVTNQGVDAPHALEIVGDGIGRTIIDNRVANGAALRLYTTDPLASQAMYVSIRGIDISGAATSPVGSHGIEFSDCWYCTVEKCAIHHLSGSALYFSSGATLDAIQNAYITVIHNKLKWCQRYGIECDGANQSLPFRLHIEKNYISRNSLGGILGYMDGARIVGNSISYNGLTANDYGGLLISGVNPPGQNAYLPRSTLIQSNWFEGNYPHEIAANYLYGIDIVNNVFARINGGGGIAGAPLYGIRLGFGDLVYPVDAVNIKKNYFKSSITNNADPYTAISASNRVTRLTVEDNIYYLNGVDTTLGFTSSSSLKLGDMGSYSDLYSYRHLAFAAPGSVIGDAALRRLTAGVLRADGGIINLRQDIAQPEGTVAPWTTAAINLANGFDLYITGVTQSVTLGAVTSPATGCVVRITVRVEAASKTITFPSAFLMSGGIRTVSLSDGSGGQRYDLFTFYTLGAYLIEAGRALNNY